jgi:DNA-binding winged helix-turn-helix (wHTH) protein/TolB-like protein
MKKRFDAFEFDTTTGELRRDGEIVRLQAQPAQVLTVLVEHEGELVTREALRQAIWGADTFVDFDKGLNFAIAQVRAALGDSAEAPRFIRTFPKRGYQFAAPVAPQATDRSDSTERSSWRARVAAAALVIALLAAATTIAWIWNGRQTTNPAHTIAVTTFDNQTGLAEYDRYAQNVTDAVVAELTLSGSGRFSIIGNAAVLRVPRQRRDIVAIGQALGARYIVIGQVQRDESRVRILAHLIQLPEQKHVWVTRIDPAPDDPSSTVTDVAQRISKEFLSKL